MNDSPIAVICDAALGTPVTTVADGTARRLQVDSRSVHPAGTNLINRYLLSPSASANMMVAGSAANPVNFSYSPPSGQASTVTQIEMLLVAGTITFNGAKFLNQTALANGITLNATVGGATSTLATLKQNEDFLLLSSGSYGAGTVGGLLSGGTNSLLMFTLSMSQTLNQATGDSIFFSVRDSMTSGATGSNLVFCQASVVGYVNV